MIHEHDYVEEIAELLEVLLPQAWTRYLVEPSPANIEIWEQMLEIAEKNRHHPLIAELLAQVSRGELE